MDNIIDFAVDIERMEELGAVGNVSETGVLSDNIAIYKQSLDMLFSTVEGEVLGDDSYGSELEQFIWDLSVSNDKITEYIHDKIISHIPISSLFNTNIETTLLKGELNDIILVKIDIKETSTGDEYSQTYKLE